MFVAKPEPDYSPELPSKHVSCLKLGKYTGHDLITSRGKFVRSTEQFTA